MKKEKVMKLLSLVSKGNRIAKVRTYGAAGFMIELTELKAEGGEVSKRHYTRLYKMLSTSIRDAQQWVDSATE
jgi:hypothetical protein